MIAHDRRPENKRLVQSSKAQSTLGQEWTDANGFQGVEAEVLKLAPLDRAKMAGKLLNSLEGLSKEEVSRLWAEEARRRDAEMDADPDS